MEEAAELREGLHGGNARLFRRVQRVVCLYFLRRVLEQWRAVVVRGQRLRLFTQWLSDRGVEFPLESVEQLGGALRMLHEHGGWTYVALSQVFEVSASTIRGMALAWQGVGVRVGNGMLERMNTVWQEHLLAQAEEEEADMSEEELSWDADI